VANSRTPGAMVIAADSAGIADAIDPSPWRFPAHSLAIFATPDNVRTFRVPNAFETSDVVLARFHLKPLIRAVSFPHAATSSHWRRSPCA
jgi:hypothetical protein